MGRHNRERAAYDDDDDDDALKALPVHTLPPALLRRTGLQQPADSQGLPPVPRRFESHAG